MTIFSKLKSNMLDIIYATWGLFYFTGCIFYLINNNFTILAACCLSASTIAAVGFILDR